jgi:hypothetical protein
MNFAKRLALGFCAILTVSIGTAHAHKVGHKTISQAKAFEILKASIAKGSIEGVEWIAKLKSWNGKNGEGFKARKPMFAHADTLEAVKKPDEPGTAAIFASKSQINPKGHYWIFSWHSPGVIDEARTFYVDAEQGVLTYAERYSSPD